MTKQFTLTKIYIAYALSIILLPLFFIYDVMHQQKQVFVFAWKNIKHDFYWNTRKLKSEIKMLDLS